MTTTPKILRTPSQLVVVALVAVCLCYGAFEARRMIVGPSIAVVFPRDGDTVTGPTVRIAGIAANAAFISVNDKQTHVDESGRFDTTVSPPGGHASLSISAADRFGNVKTKTLQVTVVNYCPAQVAVAQPPPRGRIGSVI